MEYSRELGQVLAEAVEELVVCEETGLQLNEIRDTARLEAEMKKLGRRHPNYRRLRDLHRRKTAVEGRKAAKRERMYDIARQHGYRHVAGKPKGTFVHGKSGHELTIRDDHTWHHKKSGAKRGMYSLTPIRHLKQHMKQVHPEYYK